MGTFSISFMKGMIKRLEKAELLTFHPFHFLKEGIEVARSEPDAVTP